MICRPVVEHMQYMRETLLRIDGIGRALHNAATKEPCIRLIALTASISLLSAAAFAQTARLSAYVQNGVPLNFIANAQKNNNFNIISVTTAVSMSLPVSATEAKLCGTSAFLYCWDNTSINQCGTAAPVSTTSGTAWAVQPTAGCVQAHLQVISNTAVYPNLYWLQTVPVSPTVSGEFYRGQPLTGR